MRFLFRPSILVLLSVVLALGASALVLWPRPPSIKAAPLASGDREVVWLFPATTASTWERFVTAVARSADQLKEQYPDLNVRIDDRTFPLQTAAAPELTLGLQGEKSRLVFRWYKVTSDQRAAQWVQVLCDGSRPPPLAIIGGNTSDGAIDLAVNLAQQTAQNPTLAPPLLLLTTATADQELKSDGSPGTWLVNIHGGRTFRFCFTNRQMAAAVTEFIWNRAELRPDADVVYQVVWLDDAYSMDLMERFDDALRLPLMARAAAQEWSWFTGANSTGALPLNLAGVSHSHFALPLVERVDFSVGGFDQPNRWEAPVLRRLMDVKTGQYTDQSRPLLVLTAASSPPARRFLHGLARTAPVEARRFVVATGDALAFNIIYRDRNLAWPIQDLPFNLVFFCHRNPVESSAGFPEENSTRSVPSSLSPSTGTEDLLLYTDMVTALVQAAFQEGDVPAKGDELGRRLRQARWHAGRVSFAAQGPALFDELGNRHSGTGEHIVWLRPVFKGERVQPQATIEVWAWQTNSTAELPWKRQRVLEVDYDER